MLSTELFMMAHRLSAEQPKPRGFREATLARWCILVYRVVQGPVVSRITNLWLPICYLGVCTWLLRQRTAQVAIPDRYQRVDVALPPKNRFSGCWLIGWIRKSVPIWMVLQQPYDIVSNTSSEMV